MKHTAKSINAYIKSLSSKEPTPGGGSAAALVASLAVSLTIMVARIVKPKIAKKSQKKWTDTIKDLTLIKRNVMKSIDKDPVCYKNVIAAYKLSATKKTRSKKIEKALLSSYEIMRDLAIDIYTLKKLNQEIARGAKGAIANDLRVSGLFIEASFSSAIKTAEINVAYLADEKLQKICAKEISKVKTMFKKF